MDYFISSNICHDKFQLSSIAVVEDSQRNLRRKLIDLARDGTIAQDYASVARMIGRISNLQARVHGCQQREMACFETLFKSYNFSTTSLDVRRLVVVKLINFQL